MKPFIDLAGKAIQLLTTALGRLLLGKDESKPQTRPGISNLRGLPLSVCGALVPGDEVGAPVSRSVVLSRVGQRQQPTQARRRC